MTSGRLTSGLRSRRYFLLVAALALVLGLTLLAVTLWITRGSASLQQATAIGGSFSLVDQDGHVVTEKQFEGEAYLVFFGYTHCPDVCPTTLSDMSQMLAVLGDRKVRAAFITVDPERDTPAVLKSYLSSFDPRIVGLTGSPEAIMAAEKAFRVYAKKVPAADGSYAMDHTAIVYVVDRKGRFVEALDLEQAPDKAAAEFRAVL